jgi:hypothetical protein
MAFRFRDLVIDVLHAGAGARVCGPATVEPAAAGLAPPCGPATVFGFAPPCGPATAPADIAPPDPCGPATDPAAAAAVPPCGPATDILGLRICGPATIEPQVAGVCGEATQIDPKLLGNLGSQGLASLKRQLWEALSHIEEHERAHGHAASEASMPQTKEEVEDLEKRLRGALAELEEHKKKV